MPWRGIENHITHVIFCLHLNLTVSTSYVPQSHRPCDRLFYCLFKLLHSSISSNVEYVLITPVSCIGPCLMHPSVSWNTDFASSNTVWTYGGIFYWFYYLSNPFVYLIYLQNWSLISLSCCNCSFIQRSSCLVIFTVSDAFMPTHNTRADNLSHCVQS